MAAIEIVDSTGKSALPSGAKRTGGMAAADAVRDQTIQTVLLAALHAKRLPAELHALTRAAYRAAADCERMMERLRDPSRSAWREVVGDALLAAWQLRTVVVAAESQSAGAHGALWLATLERQVREHQERIVGAMSRLLRYIPISGDDELLLQDAHALREGVADLLSLRQAPAQVGLSALSPHTVAVRVLVADDDRAVREMLRRNLVKRGFDVVLAQDGRQAHDIAMQQHVDLILSDIEMPGMDGISLLRTLKQTTTTRDVPVIVISGRDDVSSVAACIELGAEDHIAKPFDLTILDARIRASVERKRLRDVEREYLGRVELLVLAAQAVEDDRYVAGPLRALAAAEDPLGRLARVFDRAVSTLQSREERLRHRLGTLRHEMTQASGRMAPARASTESPLRAGDVLAKRYEIISEIGVGGMGTVFRARDIAIGEEVAVKVVRRELVTGDPTIVTRLKSEIRLARRISHRNVMRTHDLGEADGLHFITMELVDGLTVEQIIDRRGRLTVEATLAVAAQLADALSLAHEQQIIHRDIKPGNLIVNQEGVVKIMDFGIARSTIQPDNITLGGYIVGTPQYMAPEQLLGRNTDCQSDLFAVGVVLYECLCGRPPFSGANPAEMLQQISEGDYPRLSDLVPDVPLLLEKLTYELLHPDPQHRLKSARELAGRLNEIEVSARPRRASLMEHVEHLEAVELELVDSA